MNEEELNSIQELIDRKILLAEVTGGLTSSDKKVIALWNYTIELQQENHQLKDRIENAIEYTEYCQTSKNDIYPIIEIAKMMEILKGEENE